MVKFHFTSELYKFFCKIKTLSNFNTLWHYAELQKQINEVEYTCKIIYAYKNILTSKLQYYKKKHA